MARRPARMSLRRPENLPILTLPLPGIFLCAISRHLLAALFHPHPLHGMGVFPAGAAVVHRFIHDLVPVTIKDPPAPHNIQPINQVI
jgi:hypothetical protein